MQLTKDVIERSVLQKSQIRPSSGRVMSVAAIDHTATIDVGHTDTNGNPVYMILHYPPATPPQIGDVATISYRNLSPYSGYIGAQAVGGENSTGTVVTSAGVNSIKADSGAQITSGADVQLISGLGITLVEASPVITIRQPFWKLVR